MRPCSQLSFAEPNCFPWKIRRQSFPK